MEIYTGNFVIIRFESESQEEVAVATWRKYMEWWSSGDQEQNPKFHQIKNVTSIYNIFKYLFIFRRSTHVYNVVLSYLLPSPYLQLFLYAVNTITPCFLNSRSYFFSKHWTKINDAGHLYMRVKPVSEIWATDLMAASQNKTSTPPQATGNCSTVRCGLSNFSTHSRISTSLTLCRSWLCSQNHSYSQILRWYINLKLFILVSRTKALGR